MQLTSHELLIILGTLLGGAVGVNLVGQILKKLFRLKTDSVIHTMILTLSGAASIAEYVMQIKGQLPPQVLGISGPAIYGFSQIFFKYAKYGSNFMKQVSAYEASLKASAVSDAAVAAVVAPTAAELDDSEQTPNEANF